MIDVYWKEIFKYNLSVYIQIINCHLFDNGYTTVQINKTLKKLSFPLPKGLLKKEIEGVGTYPVVSQSKKEVIGRSNRKDLLVEKDLPLIVYGDHSKTIKYIDYSFVVGADGIKLLKPNSSFYEKYFYYSLIGTQTDIKNYGRHFSLLKNKSIMFPDIKLQKKIALFLDDFNDENIRNSMYFDEKIENKIMALHENSIKGLELKTELTYQQTLIKKLRQQILQEAIEGKLTAEWRKRFSPLPRGGIAKRGDGEYEHASVLLERIIAKKNQMIKDKKIRPHKMLPPIPDEDKLFPIPSGWVWCRLGDVGLFERGKSKHRPRNDESLFLNGQYPFVQTGDIAQSKKCGFKINTFSKQYNDKGLSQSRLWKKGALCITIAANIAETGFLDIDACLPDSVVGFTSLSNDSTSKYVKYYIDATRDEIERFAPATAQKNINLGIINMLSCPLPSLSEQGIIVEKVEKLLALCDQLESTIAENKTQAKQLMRAVLKEAFGQK